MLDRHGLDQSVSDWLDHLASADPAPGGGAAAAMNAAVGAALVSMVCRLTLGKPRYAESAEVMTQTLEAATRLQARALGLAAEDAAAFDAVAFAYRMPKESPSERTERTAAIQMALVEAAAVPLRTAALAADVIDLAGRILAGANINVISDVAVAAASAQAALTAATINVEVNLAAMTDPATLTELRAEVLRHRDAIGAANNIVAAVRERINDRISERSTQGAGGTGEGAG